MTVKVISGR